MIRNRFRKRDLGLFGPVRLESDLRDLAIIGDPLGTFRAAWPKLDRERKLHCGAALDQVLPSGDESLEPDRSNPRAIPLFLAPPLHMLVGVESAFNWSIGNAEKDDVWPQESLEVRLEPRLTNGGMNAHKNICDRTGNGCFVGR